MYRHTNSLTKAHLNSKSFFVFILLLLTLMLSSCGPRQGVDVANWRGVQQEIEVVEADEGLTGVTIQIKFNGMVVEKSSIKEWKTLEQNFRRFVKSKQITVNGQQLEARRVQDAGLNGATVSFRFYDAGMLVASVHLPV